MLAKWDNGIISWIVELVQVQLWLNKVFEIKVGVKYIYIYI